MGTPARLIAPRSFEAGEKEGCLARVPRHSELYRPRTFSIVT